MKLTPKQILRLKKENIQWPWMNLVWSLKCFHIKNSFFLKKKRTLMAWKELSIPTCFFNINEIVSLSSIKITIVYKTFFNINSFKTKNNIKKYIQLCH